MNIYAGSHNTNQNQSENLAHFKVDREDHFQCPDFLHITICAFLGYKVSNFVLKNWMLPMFKKPQNLKGLTMNPVQGLFKQCSHIQIFSLFVERNLMDSSYIVWNKFQDYQLRFIKKK